MSLKNITSEDAYLMLQHQPLNTYLIDVRTEAEWQEIGVPKLEEGNLIFLSLFLNPSMEPNTNFYKDLTMKIKDKAATLLFLCRSGGRSAIAAANMMTLGYSNVFNIIDGFEGNNNQAAHIYNKKSDLTANLNSGTISSNNKIYSRSGWRNNNLPWQNI